MNHLARTILTFCMISALTLGACTGGSSPSQANQEHSEEPEALSNRIEIPPTVRSNLGITFAKVERRRVDSTIRVPGAFELQPLARREYRLTLPGHIELAVDQYDRVEPGDLLYRYRSPEWPELQHEIIVGEQEIETAHSAIEVAESRITETEQRLAITRERIASLTQAQVRNAELEAQAAELEAMLP
ncbi:MAG: efflux RND transporter periplasmic adaptor subunit, partial [bacterium]|nr:efflux RND transporter periplasmic adaptor subunit [bacterium]